MEAEENSGKNLMFSVGPLKFIDAERVVADQKAFLLDEDYRRIQTRTLGRVDLIFGAADAVLVEMHEGVVQAHPNVAVLGVHAKRGKNRAKVRRSVARFLALDGFTGSLRFGVGVEAGKFEVQAGIAVAVVLAHKRLRH